MANVDFVKVGPGPSLDEIRDAVRRVTDSTLVEGRTLYPPEGSPHSFIRVTHDAETPGANVVLIYYASGPVERRHVLAHQVQEGLAADTDWQVEVDLDRR
jgi:hypothetical protein